MAVISSTRRLDALFMALGIIGFATMMIISRADGEVRPAALPSAISISPILAAVADEASALCAEAERAIHEEKWGQAELPLTRCLILRDQSLGGTHPQTIKTLGQLADLLFQLDRLSEAAGYYARLAAAADNGIIIDSGLLDRARTRRIVGG